MIPRLSISGPYAVSPLQIPLIEEARHCRYIGSSSIPINKETGDGGWSYNPLDIFWSPIKHPKSDEHLFGIYRRDGRVYIRDTNKFSGVVTGVFIPSTNVLTYSTYRHDFFCPNDSAPDSVRVCVDGGRDYLKINGNRDDYEVVTINLIERTFYGVDKQTKNFAVEFSSNSPGCGGNHGTEEAWEGYGCEVAD